MVGDQQDDPGGQPLLSLRYVVFGGEVLELESLWLWLDRHGNLRPRLINRYDIREAGSL